MQLWREEGRGGQQMRAITKATLRGVGIYNGYDVARFGTSPHVYIRYSAQQMGRAYQPWYWAISVPGKRTDPSKSQWREGGDLAFGGWHYCTYSAHKENSDHALGDAKSRAAEMFGVMNWERSPFGDWHPVGAVRAAYESKKATVAVEA